MSWRVFFLKNGFISFYGNASLNSSSMVSPYPNSSGSDSNQGRKDNYNFYHSCLFIRVECTFGMLVQRWGILQNASHALFWWRGSLELWMHWWNKTTFALMNLTPVKLTRNNWQKTTTMLLQMQMVMSSWNSTMSIDITVPMWSSLWGKTLMQLFKDMSWIILWKLRQEHWSWFHCHWTLGTTMGMKWTGQ